MFTGHYAAGFALKGLDKGISLGLLFLATQFLDILFFFFALAGIEQYKVVKDYLPASHFQALSFPFTHGLTAVMLWGLAAFLICYGIVFRKDKKPLQSALIIAGAIISHWFLDLIVHVRDLPLVGDNSIKVGFGVWRNAPLSFIVESCILLGGYIFYMKRTRPVSPWGTYGMGAFVLFLISINILLIFGPFTVTSKVNVTLSVMMCYTLFTVTASLLERFRT